MYRLEDSFSDEEVLIVREVKTMVFFMANVIVVSSYKLIYGY